MIGIFFIYGLAFFVLGFSVLLYPRKRSELKIARHLWLIAAFGITHGLNEWIDTSFLIQSSLQETYLKTVRLFVLPVSFYFLVLFGVNTFTETARKYSLLRVLPVVLPLAWAIITAAGADRYLTGDIMARYLLCIPGTVLTSLAFLSLLPELRQTRSPALIGSLWWTAAAFLLYGLFAGLIVPKAGFSPASVLNASWFDQAAAVPIQVPRAFCAVVTAVSIIRVLSVFEWETNKALRDSEERYRIMEQTALAEKAMRRSEERLSLARAAAQIGISDYDMVSGAIQWDSRVRELWGLEPDEPVTYEVFLSGLHPDDREQTRAAMQRARDPSGDGRYYAEYRVINRKDHVERWAAATGKVFFEQGRPVRLVGIVQDITERKRSEEEINELNRKLAANVRDVNAANKELEAFTYSVSHDLRAPLRSLSGFSTLLKQRYAGKFDARGNQYLDWVIAGAGKMNQIVDDLLGLSRVSRQPVAREDVDLHRLAASVVSELRLANPGRRVSVEIQEPLHASADPGLVKVLLVNLIGNAWKFTSKTENARIEFRSLEREGETVFSVKDNGAGFDSAQAGRLFQPFQRLHSEEEFEGTGIGLAIVERVVRRHGGRVWAEGKPNEGATFFFTLE